MPAEKRRSPPNTPPTIPPIAPEDSPCPGGGCEVAVVVEIGAVVLTGTADDWDVADDVVGVAGMA